MEWDGAKRDELLAHHHELVEQIEDLETDEPGADRLPGLRARLEDVRAAYVRMLPDRPLTRSPVSSEVVSRAFDDVDIDGLWWQYDRPARPFAPPSGGLIAFDGAMLIGEPVANSPILVSPGAEVPSVVPEVLESHGARAVVSEVRVGQHRGFIVAYFSTRVDPDRPLLDDWGAKEHWRPDHSGDWVRGHRPDHEVERDYDLARWIEAERLSWIEPGDTTRTLRTDRAGCPFLDVQGRRSRSYIQYGRVWSADDSN